MSSGVPMNNPPSSPTPALPHDPVGSGQTLGPLCSQGRRLAQITALENLPAGPSPWLHEAHTHALAFTPAHFQWCEEWREKGALWEGRRGEMAMWSIAQTESDFQDCLCNPKPPVNLCVLSSWLWPGKQSLNFLSGAGSAQPPKAQSFLQFISPSRC